MYIPIPPLGGRGGAHLSPRQTLQTVRVVWFGLLASVAIYQVVLLAIGPTPDPGSPFNKVLGFGIGGLLISGGVLFSRVRRRACHEQQ